MNLRISLLIAAYFVNVFADQSKWTIHGDVRSNNDDVDFMSQELLLPVKTKTITKAKPVKVTVSYIDQSKPELVQSSNTIDNRKINRQSPPSVEDELSSEEFLPVKLKQNIPPKSTQVKPKSVSIPQAQQSATKKTDDHPCKDKDVKCMLAKDKLLLSTTPKPLGAGRQELIIDNHYSVNHNAELPLPSEQLQKDILQEPEVEESDEDILRSISDESINRYRRQATPDDGGSGAGFFEESTTTNENPEFSIEMDITLEDPETDPLTNQERSDLRQKFEDELTNRFKFIPGFKSIKINDEDIILDSQNRPKAKFNIVLDGNVIGALGATPEERFENISDTIRQAGDVFNSTDEIAGRKTLPMNIQLDDYIQKLEILVSDVCESDKPCNEGYVCSPGTTATGEYEGTCVHSCYSTKLNELCQNGAICTLDGNSQPYCQCGTKHTGVFCENDAATVSGELSTAEVVGITTGTLLAMAALASCVFFIVFCRKRHEKDMEYSYYGDDDNLMQGYLDQSSNLGISNMYIDRPRISIQPLDIYNDPALGAHA